MMAVPRRLGLASRKAESTTAKLQGYKGQRFLDRCAVHIDIEIECVPEEKVDILSKVVRRSALVYDWATCIRSMS